MLYRNYISRELGGRGGARAAAGLLTLVQCSIHTKRCTGQGHLELVSHPQHLALRRSQEMFEGNPA